MEVSGCRRGWKIQSRRFGFADPFGIANPHEGVDEAIFPVLRCHKQFEWKPILFPEHRQSIPANVRFAWVRLKAGDLSYVLDQLQLIRDWVCALVLGVDSAFSASAAG